MGWLKGKPRGKQSLSHIKKLSLARKLRSFSVETKQKMSMSAKKAWEVRRKAGKVKGQFDVRYGYCQMVKCPNRGKRFNVEELWDYRVDKVIQFDLKVCKDCLKLFTKTQK